MYNIIYLSLTKEKTVVFLFVNSLKSIHYELTFSLAVIKYKMMFSHKASTTIIFILGINKHISSIHIIIFAFLFNCGIYLKKNINNTPSGIKKNKKYELKYL